MDPVKLRFVQCGMADIKEEIFDKQKEQELPDNCVCVRNFLQTHFIITH